MRQIFLDTETTGLDPALGNRILEIGGVEIVNRQPTGKHFHRYINPERDSEEGALQVHGITREFLADKPKFREIAQEFLDYIAGAELVKLPMYDPDPGTMTEAGKNLVEALRKADGVIVSNHGGRQLDGADSSIQALPAVVDAVGSQIEVHMDGGIRSGQDVLKARALGARGVYIGRAMLYGLGAMGQAGVTKALQIIHKEMDISMALCGRTDINQVDHSILLPGTYPSA